MDGMNENNNLNEPEIPVYNPEASAPIEPAPEIPAPEIPVYGDPDSGFGSQNGFNQAPYGNAPQPGYGAPIYGQGQPQGGYNGQPPYTPPTYDPSYVTPKKSNTGAIIAAVIGLVVVLCIAVVGLAFSLNAYNKDRKRDNLRYSDNKKDYDDDRDDDFDYWDDDDELFDDYDWDDDDDESYTGGGIDMGEYIDWDDTSWKNESPNVDPSRIENEDMYQYFRNCIDETTDYSFEFETESFEDESESECFRIQYYQVHGTPNDDEINEVLYNEAMRQYNYYYDNKDEFDEYAEKYGKGILATCEAFVTYNDDEMFSVVYNMNYNTTSESEARISCVNVDVTTGEIIDNVDAVDADKEFARKLRKLMIEQNGDSCSASRFTDDELYDYLIDDDAVIYYINPAGTEVGANWEYGWITSTIHDGNIDK